MKLAGGGQGSIQFVTSWVVKDPSCGDIDDIHLSVTLMTKDTQPGSHQGKGQW